MSKYDLGYLRNNIRVGYVKEDGPAWWADSDYMADGTHFDGPVPIDVVHDILNVPLVRGNMTVTYTGTDGESHAAKNTADFAPIVRADTGHMFRVFKDGYNIHQYQEWLIEKVSRILDTSKGDLTAKSVGLLRHGAQAWLQIRLPETFEVAGFGFVPFLTAATSADGTLASMRFLGVDAAVCDNTFDAAVLSALTKEKVKHTKNSNDNPWDSRDALGLLFKVKESFEEAANNLLSVPVTEEEWNAWLDLTVPVPEAKEGARGTRGVTIRQNKRDQLTDLYFTDEKVKPWNGTAFGVLQADNTWRTWNGTVRGADGGRMERYYSNAIDGTVGQGDSKALKALSKVLGRELITA